MNDLSAFFDPADGFVVEASLDGADPIYVHLDAGFAEALDIATAAPVVTARTADVTAAARGSVLTINGDDYEVRGIEPDGTGLTVLRLWGG
jgi:hypothetical protein